MSLVPYQPERPSKTQRQQLAHDLRKIEVDRREHQSRTVQNRTDSLERGRELAYRTAVGWQVYEFTLGRVEVNGRRIKANWSKDDPEYELCWGLMFDVAEGIGQATKTFIAGSHDEPSGPTVGDQWNR